MPAPSSVPRPLLVIVRGKPRSGKTTLARRLAETAAFGLPLLSHDALKVGLVETHGSETDTVRDTVVPLAYALFYQTIELWLRAGVSLIAEDSFPRDRSESTLRALLPLAHTVVIHCDTSDEEAQRRFCAREGANPEMRGSAAVVHEERAHDKSGREWRSRRVRSGRESTRDSMGR